MLSLRMLALKAAVVLTACGTGSPADPTPIPVSVAAILVPEEHVVVLMGHPKLLQAIPVDAEGQAIPNVAVTWESLNAGIVAVSAAGEATTRSSGTTTIIARAGGLEAAITVTVAPRPIPFP